MRWWYWILLVVWWGCAPLPQKKPRALATPQPGYVQVEKDILELPLDSLWQAQPVPVGKHWWHPRMGRLTATILELKPLEKRWPEWIQLCQAKDLSPLRQVLSELSKHPLYKSELARLEDWVKAGNRSQLEAWLKKAQKAWATQDFGALMKLRLQLDELGRHPAIGEMKISQIDGQPAATTGLATQGGVGFGFYVKRGEKLLALQLMNYRFDTRAESLEWFTKTVAGVHRVERGQVADASLLQEPRPEPPTPAAQVQGGRRKHRQHRSDSPWMRALLPWAAALVAALVLGLPAYGGATAGYERAQFEGTNPRVGAAGGAFQSTLSTYFLLLGMVIVVVLVLAAVYNTNGGGIMSLFMAAILFSVVGGLVAVVYILIAAALSAVGAFIGAAAGPRQAGWLAVLGVLLSAFVTPVYMKLADAKYERERQMRRRYHIQQTQKEMAHVQRALSRCRYRDSADLRGDVSV